MKYILAIDQGTTSTRAILFDQKMQIAATAQKEFAQHFPASGWVEHDPDEIWSTTIDMCREVMSKQGVQASDIASIGITNQRETTIVWDKASGRPIYNAIVWQDRRTSDTCKALKADGLESMITRKTGLLLDPYFSATKIKWILDNVDGARTKAATGGLLFGTVDCFLLWKLTGGKVHATEATNAARTMIYDIRNGVWDTDICQLLDIPMNMLPEVRDCASDFGNTAPDLLHGQISIHGIAGDQQAATIGQACFAPGMFKSTYGTGCFALLNTGDRLVTSQNRLLGTIAYQLDGKTTYALEGSIFVAGAAVQWLRDGLGIVGHASETQKMAEAASDNENVYMVPAFTGLGAPHWDADSRGAIFGITRSSNQNDFARAALESVGYQTRDLMEAMQADWGGGTKGILRVDGGMSANDWAMQFLSDILGTPVDRPNILETTALGAAWLAGMHAGLYPSQSEFAKSWSLERQFTPSMDDATRGRKYAGWKDSVRRCLTGS
ncbi:MAG: glycerol kinase GlpK [Paracoccaceae bacterium]|jgi:glycerol kinase